MSLPIEKSIAHCQVPDVIHPVCREVLDVFIAGQTSVHTPAYVCNMVDSRLIPMVECLLKTFADGVLLIPAIF